jgi:hypothetical protein
MYSTVLTPGLLMYCTVLTPGLLMYSTVLTPGLLMYCTVLTPGLLMYSTALSDWTPTVLHRSDPRYSTTWNHNFIQFHGLDVGSS